MEKLNVWQKLMQVQNELKAPKGQYNNFGKYKYRSCEDIVEAVKPIAKKYGCVLLLDDCIKNFGTHEPHELRQLEYDKYRKVDVEVVTIYGSERFYIEATASFINTEDGERIEASALARESEHKKGMDESQITGTASSYARKYALNGLFAIDDTKDADTDEAKKLENKETKTVTPKKVEKDERSKLIEYLDLTGITMQDVAKTYKLNANTTQARFKEVLEDLLNEK